MPENLGELSVVYRNIDGIISDDRDEKVCRDYLRNVCDRVRCRYRHDKPTDGIMSVVAAGGGLMFCHDYQNNAECPRPNCKFIHCSRDEEEEFKRTGKLPIRIHIEAVRKHQITIGSPVCKNYLNGECRRSTLCKFRHLTKFEYEEEIFRLLKQSDHNSTANVAAAVKNDTIASTNGNDKPRTFANNGSQTMNLSRDNGCDMFVTAHNGDSIMQAPNGQIHMFDDSQMHQPPPVINEYGPTEAKQRRYSENNGYCDLNTTYANGSNGIVEATTLANNFHTHPQNSQPPAPPSTQMLQQSQPPPMLLANPQHMHAPQSQLAMANLQQPPPQAPPQTHQQLAQNHQQHIAMQNHQYPPPNTSAPPPNQAITSRQHSAALQTHHRQVLTSHVSNGLIQPQSTLVATLAANGEQQHVAVVANTIAKQQQEARILFLEDENSLLHKQIADLKKQVSDLTATNEFLLEQNAQFRVSTKLHMGQTHHHPVTSVTVPAVTITNTTVPTQLVTASMAALPVSIATVTTGNQVSIAPCVSMAPVQAIPTVSISQPIATQQIIATQQPTQLIATTELPTSQLAIATANNGTTQIALARQSITLRSQSIPTQQLTTSQAQQLIANDTQQQLSQAAQHQLALSTNGQPQQLALVTTNTAQLLAAAAQPQPNALVATSQQMTNQINTSQPITISNAVTQPLISYPIVTQSVLQNTLQPH